MPRPNPIKFPPKETKEPPKVAARKGAIARRLEKNKMQREMTDKAKK